MLLYMLLFGILYIVVLHILDGAQEKYVIINLVLKPKSLYV